MGSENPDWLPEGWQVTVKVRRYGKKDKYYIDPSSSLKFNSKPEVLRHLHSSAEVQKPTEQNKVDFKKTAAEELPPGWTKEIRTRKKGRKIRKDPYYIDPVSGREFRSMKEIFRYLQTKDSGMAKSKPADKDRFDAKSVDHSQLSPVEAKEQILIDKKADKKVPVRKNENSEVELVKSSKGAAVNNINMEQKEDASLTTKLFSKIPPVSREDRYSNRMWKRKEVTENKADKHVDVDARLKSGSKVVVPRKVDMPDATSMEQRQRKDHSMTGDLPNKLSKVIGEEKHAGHGVNPNKRLAESKLENDAIGGQSELELVGDSKSAAVNNVNMPEGNHVDQREDASLTTEYSCKIQTVNRMERYANRMRKRQEVTKHKVDKSADGDKKLKPGSKVGVPIKEVDKPEATYVEQRQKEGLYIAAELPNKLPKVNENEKHEGGVNPNKRLGESKLENVVIAGQFLQSGSKNASVKKINIPETNGSQQKEEEKNSVEAGSQYKKTARLNKRKNSNTSDLPRRTSKRLARVEINPSLEVKTSNIKATESAEAQVSEVRTAEDNGRQAILSGEPNTITSNEKVDKHKETTGHPANLAIENPTGNKQKEPTILPVRNLEKVDEKQQLDSSLKDILMDPCIEFAIKTLTGAIPFEDVRKFVVENKSLTSPNHHQTSYSVAAVPNCGGVIWTDPSFEFAVKTLTSDLMPPREVTSGSSSCNSNLNLPMFRLDNGHNSNYSFGKVHNGKKPQQDQVRESNILLPPHSSKYGSAAAAAALTRSVDG